MDYIIHFIFERCCTLNKTSPNTGILLKGVLIARLLNNLFASCFLKNFDFLALHIALFDNIIVLPLLVAETLRSILPVFFFAL